MFRGSVKGTGYPLHSPVSPSLPLPCVTVCHLISTGVYSMCEIVFIFVLKIFVLRCSSNDICLSFVLTFYVPFFTLCVPCSVLFLLMHTIVLAFCVQLYGLLASGGNPIAVNKYPIARTNDTRFSMSVQQETPRGRCKICGPNKRWKDDRP